MEKLSESMIEAVTALGEEIKKSEAFAALKVVADAYMQDEALKTAIDEYNIQQTALATVSTTNKDDGDEISAVIEKRLEELYDTIVGNESYRAYVTEKEKYDEYYHSVMDELQFVITGVRPCTHDCSSCSSHCHDHEHDHSEG